MAGRNAIDYNEYAVMLIQASQLLLSRADKIAEYAKIMEPLYKMERLERLSKYSDEILVSKYSDKILEVEKTLFGYTLDFRINVDEPADSSDIIEHIVYQVRHNFDVHLRGKFSCAIDDMSGECYNMTRDVSTFCKAFRIECIPFEFRGDLLNHFAALVILPNGEEYVVDCTYQQFFLLSDNLPNRHVIIAGRVHNAYVGNTIVQMNEEAFARKLIEKGYFKVTDATLKTYIDSLIKTFYNIWNQYKYLSYSSTDYLAEIKKARFIGDVRR